MQNDISTLFTQVHAIVLPQRKEYIKNTFRKMGITYSEFDCVLGSSLNKTKLINAGILDPKSNLRINEIACALSHLGVIKKFYNTSRNSNDTCLIFEDDISYEPDHFNKMKKCMNNMPKDWEFINFGRCWDNCSSQIHINEYTVTSENSLCAHSYAITRDCAKKILDSCFPIYVPIDVYYVDTCKIYSSSPRIYSQLKNSNYDMIIGKSTLGNNDSSKECMYRGTESMYLLYKNRYRNRYKICFFLLCLILVYIFYTQIKNPKPI